MGSNSRVNAYEQNRTVDSENVPIEGGTTTTSLDDTLAGRNPHADGKGIEFDNERVYRTDQLDEEAFMRDELEILLAEPGNENDPSFVEITVNGDYRLGIRGDTCKMRRYHVAILAQAKQSRVRQRKIVNPDGSMGFVEENVLSLSYPFQVIHDPNPKLGGSWLRNLLKAPI